MPVILRKANTPVPVMSTADPSLEALINISDAESATAAEDKKADRIKRHTTAEMLGITIRTLQRWHHENYGPKRISKGGPIRYSRAEVMAWVAEHGRGSHRPRSGRGG
jgi:predicted DNA-binding transcriptional regulator AlpA